jgi:hypothetical protein
MQTHRTRQRSVSVRRRQQHVRVSKHALAELDGVSRLRKIGSADPPEISASTCLRYARIFPDNTKIPYTFSEFH